MDKRLLFALRGHTLRNAIVAKRGRQNMRAAAGEIGISASSLSRIERGAEMDMLSFLLLCTWLERPPSDFFTQRQAGSQPVEIRTQPMPAIKPYAYRNES